MGEEWLNSALGRSQGPRLSIEQEPVWVLQLVSGRFVSVET